MRLIEFINRNILWGIPMLALMLGTGLHLTVASRGRIFRNFGSVLSCTLGSLFKSENKSSENGITPFQAVSTALAGTVGTGNIAGVSIALAIGGPGAVFWMWLPALLGMTTKYSEVTLAVAYRRKGKNGIIKGGAMYYISEGLGSQRTAVFFCVCGSLCALSLGNMVQINTMASAAEASFGASRLMICVAAAVISFVLLKGGIKRIAAFSEIVIPIMAGFYIVGTMAVIFFNIENLLPTIQMIFRCAFTKTAATGGFAGSSVMLAMRIGTARGVFTNEAGLGSAPTAHAAAITDHPARQGLWGAFEVFFDTIIMCTLTSLAILTSGAWPSFTAYETDELTQLAFGTAIPGGEYMVTICVIIFAFETVTAWYYYGEKFVEFIGGDRLRKIYFAVYITVILFGGIVPTESVWELADFFNGIMALPNLAALNYLAKEIGHLTEDFFAYKPTTNIMKVHK